MPSLTPRGYPYSDQTDPADIPQAIEDLALAIDTDVEAVSETIIARPAFRVAGQNASIPLSHAVSPNLALVSLPFNRVVAVTSGALEPLAGTQARVVPALPGFWWVQAILNFPRANGANIDHFYLQVQTGATVMTRAGSHILPPASNVSESLVATAGIFMNGTTDYFEMIGAINKTASTSGTYTFNSWSLFAVRMTES